MVRRLVSGLLVLGLLAALLLALATALASSATALASTASVSGLVCVAGLLAPFALAGAALAGYVYACTRSTCTRPRPTASAPGAVLGAAPAAPTILIMGPRQPNGVAYGVRSALPAPPGPARRRHADLDESQVTPMLASIYGLGDAESGGEDE